MRIRRSGTIIISILIFLLSLVFLGSRLPFYQQTPRYEEGLFAYLFSCQPANPQYFLIGRIHGQEILGPPQHPAPMYELIGFVGYGAQHFIKLSNHLESHEVFFTRVFFSLPFLLVLICLSIMIVFSLASWRRRFLALTFLLILSLLPLSVVGSTELQIDGSVGVALMGSFSLLLMEQFFRQRRQLLSHILLFAGFFLGSLGKNEWSLALLFGSVCAALYALGLFLFNRSSIKQQINTRQTWSWFTLAFAGQALGNLFSYVFDPDNYRAGLQLMSRLSRSGLARSDVLGHWLDLTQLRIAYAAPIIVLFLISSFFLIRKTFQKEALPPTITTLYATGTALLFGFFFSLWNNEIRYFMPALIIFGCLFILLIIEGYFPDPVLIGLEIVAVIYLLIALPIGWFALPPKEKSLTGPRSCIQVLSIGQAYNRPDVDFLANSLSRRDIIEIARQHNADLCPPKSDGSQK